MGLVKYGNLTLNVAEIPDGNIVVAEQEFNNLRQTNNAFLELKSKIPIGVDPNQLGQLVEKGQRFDAINTDFQRATTQSQELQKKLDAVKNLPEGYSEEKWNSYVKRDMTETRNRQISELTKKVYDKVKSETGVDVDIDPRFIQEPADFDPSKPEAFDSWYKTLDAAHTAQTEFTQKQLGRITTPVAAVGASQSVPGHTPTGAPGRTDVITSTGIKVASL